MKNAIKAASRPGGTVTAAVIVAFAAIATAQPPQRVSIRADGTQGNAASSGAVTSANGECVAFWSDATNLLTRVGGGGDRNGVRDVFLFDRRTGQLSRVSEGMFGEADGPSQLSFRPAIDDACTCVAFESDATNLVAGDTNGQRDVFVRSLTTGSTERVSVGAGGEGNGASSFPSVSGDCSRVAFHSTADNLVEDDGNARADVFVRDRIAGTTARVSVAADGSEANGSSITPSISGDGNCVAFASTATNLLGEDTNGVADIYVACRDGDGNWAVNCRASVASDGTEANGDSFLPALNQDGTIVAFKSVASNLVPGDHNGAADVFVHDCVTGETERVSLSMRNREGNDNSFPPSISGDGRMVAFGSFASNMLAGLSTHGQAQVYVRDRFVGETILVSQTPQGQAMNGAAPDIPPGISRSGAFVAFASLASELVPGDTNGAMDVFLKQIEICADDSECPAGQVCGEGVCVPPTPTPTPTFTETPVPVPTDTPTPTPVPCFCDQDCPLGQVCQSGVCAQIACGTDEDCGEPANADECPGSRACVEGRCRAVPAPPPLPTCTADEDCVFACGSVEDCIPRQDCVDGFCSPQARCRAMKCVAPRACDDSDPEIDRLECRGVRETCVGGACECGGDCNLDGIVFGSEISTAVKILGDPATFPLSLCPAADIDFPPDGQVLASEITRAVTNLGLGCPGEGLPLELAIDRSDEIRALEVGSATAVRGGEAVVRVTLSGGAEVATVQFDLLLRSDVFELPDTAAACALDERLSGTHELFAFLPQVPTEPEGFFRLRLAVLDLAFPVDDFGEGPLFSCRLPIRADAPAGDVLLGDDENRRQIADAAGNEFGSELTGGAVTVTDCTSDEQCPGGEQCREDGSCRPGECDTGADCGADLRQACVDATCVCAGDCNGDGMVRVDEVTKVVAILEGEVALEECPAADGNGDGMVRVDEITRAVVNLDEGCPQR